jgi:phosphate transport system protein
MKGYKMERHFHEEVEQFHTNLLKMASMVGQSLENAFLALKNQDKVLAEKVIGKDKEIDELEIMNDEQAIDLLALYQPMAVDLRRITTGMRINSELEMMADLIVNIAQLALVLADQPLIKPLADIERLVGVARDMIKKVGDAFIKRDILLAKEVIASDHESNKLRDKIMSELIHEYMVKDGSIAPKAVPLLLVARDLERMCDFAASMAEDVIYMIQAKVVKHHRERLEDGNE